MKNNVILNNVTNTIVIKKANIIKRTYSLKLRYIYRGKS